MINETLMTSLIMERVKIENARSKYTDTLSDAILTFMLVRYIGIKNAEKLGFSKEDDNEKNIDKLIQLISDSAKEFTQNSIDKNDEHFIKAVKDFEKDFFEMDAKINVICL